MRLRVTEVLELPAADLSREGVLEERPDLAGEEPTRNLLLTATPGPFPTETSVSLKLAARTSHTRPDLENPGLIYGWCGAKVPLNAYVSFLRGFARLKFRLAG